MLRFFSLLLLFTAYIACNQERSVSRDTLNLSDINLVITSDISIDSIWVSDMGQKESFFLPFKDTIKVDFKRDLNDLYNLYIHTGGKRIGKQVWLDGERLLIDLQLENKQLTVKNVDSSSLYNASLRYEKKYEELLTSKADSATVDTYLISEIRNHIDTPFSHAIVANYLFRNQNNRDKVDHVNRIMRMQTDSLQRHLINNKDKIKTILDKEAVKFADYTLGDRNDQKRDITLDASKRYLLDFWFVQCPPCLRDHKRIAKNLDIFKDHHVKLIGISRDTNYKLWKNYLDKNNYPWINLREQVPEKRLTYDLSIWEFPTYVLIDHQGNIQARFRSFAQFKNYINKEKQ